MRPTSLLLAITTLTTIACATPRIDRPANATVTRGDHAGIRFERAQTTVVAPGFAPDPSSQLYVVEALNKAVDGEANDAPVKTNVVLGADIGPQTAQSAQTAPPVGGSGPYAATITTQVGDEKVTTKETGVVGSPPLALFSLISMAVGTAAISVGSAILPLNPGIAPTLGLAGCGLAALGCGFGAGAVHTTMVEKDASDLLARAIQKHGADLSKDERIARPREIAPAPRDVRKDDPAVPVTSTTSTTSSTSKATWFAGIDGKQVQMTSDELVNAVQRGRIVGPTLVWREGMSQWQPARDVDELDDILRGNGWSAAIDGKPVGPLSRDQFMAHVSAGKIGAATLVWRPGMKDWVRADTVQELSGALFDVEE